jgi:hypothetical protein
VDADEASSRVRIGVERGSPGQARSLVARLGIPAEAVMVEETEPIRLAAGLRDRVRPIVGGLQINFPGYLCTLGFNAVRGTQNSFITNSHCTKTQGGTDGTPYWQPTQTVDPVQIGTEVDDPVYFRNSNGCPKGRRCRWSDASRAAYAPNISFDLGGIAQTSGPNNGSLTIAGTLNITGKAAPASAQTVNKVSRTTGVDPRAITNTCVNTGVSAPTSQAVPDLRLAKVGPATTAPLCSGHGRRHLVSILWGAIPRGPGSCSARSRTSSASRSAQDF